MFKFFMKSKNDWIREEYESWIVNLNINDDGVFKFSREKEGDSLFSFSMSIGEVIKLCFDFQLESKILKLRCRENQKLDYNLYFIILNFNEETKRKEDLRKRELFIHNIPFKGFSVEQLCQHAYEYFIEEYNEGQLSYLWKERIITIPKSKPRDENKPLNDANRDIEDTSMKEENDVFDFIQEIYSEEDVFSFLENLAYSVSIEHQINLSSAYQLLKEHQYLLRGITVPTSYAQSFNDSFTFVAPAEDFHCGICFENSDNELKFGRLECNHVFCVDCWSTYLQKSDNFLELSCPGEKCDRFVGFDTFQALFSDESKVMKVYVKQWLNHFIQYSNRFFYCQNPKSCKFTAILPCFKNSFAITDIKACEQKHRTLQCKCGFLACGSCSFELHLPLSCAEWKLWVHYTTTQREDKKTKLSIDIRPCPNPVCNTPTVKLDGCLYLVCAKCRCHWCWECGGFGGGRTNKPLPHHVFSCSNPKNEGWLKKEVNLNGEGKFDYYRDKFDNMRALLAKTSEDEELLSVARRVLSNSFAKLFLFKNERAKEIFRGLQERLEACIKDYVNRDKENEEYVKQTETILRGYVKTVLNYKPLDIEKEIVIA